MISVQDLQLPTENVENMKYSDFVAYCDDKITQSISVFADGNLINNLLELQALNSDQATKINHLWENAKREMGGIQGADALAAMALPGSEGDKLSIPIQEQLTAAMFYQRYYDVCVDGQINFQQIIDLESAIIKQLTEILKKTPDSDLKQSSKQLKDVLDADRRLNYNEKAFFEFRAKEDYLTYSMHKLNFTLTQLATNAFQKLAELQGQKTRQEDEERANQESEQNPFSFTFGGDDPDSRQPGIENMEDIDMRKTKWRCS